MNRKSSARLWLVRSQIVTVAIVAATNCSAPPQLPLPDESPFEPAVRTEGATISIYVDGTESMRGFVTPPSDSNSDTTYQDLLPTVVDYAIQQLWPSAPTSYFRFGSAVTPLEPDDLGVVQTWLQVPTLDFYTDERVLYNTYIQLAVDHVSNADLKILVTDLYQANAEVTTLLASLSKQSFDVGRTIGITAVRSEFNGRVFTEAVGSGTQTFTYTSYRNDCDVACMRPFYLIAIGQHADVEAFQNVIKDRAALREGQLYQLHITAERSDGLASLKNSRVTDSNQILELVENMSLIAATPGGERTFREFLRHNGDAQLTLHLTNPIEHWSDTDPLAPTVTLTVDEWTTNNAGGGSFEPTNIAGASAGPGAESNDLVVEIPTGALNTPNASYRVTIDIARNEAAMTSDAWVDDWTVPLGARGVEAVGPKTINLKNLIDGLWSALRAEAIPQLAKFRLYLHVS